MPIRELGRPVIVRKKYSKDERFMFGTRYYVEVLRVADGFSLEIGPLDKSDWRDLEVGHEHMLDERGCLQRT